MCILVWYLEGNFIAQQKGCRDLSVIASHLTTKSTQICHKLNASKIEVSPTRSTRSSGILTMQSQVNT
jgi:hypothetical protein